MKSSAFLFALRAATKVAFATSVVGCGGVVVVENGETGETESDETFAADDDDGSPLPEPIVEPQEECTAPAAGWETYDEPTFDCCVDAITARIEVGPLAFGTEVDEEVEGCCGQLVAPNYDSLWAGGPLAYDAPPEVLAACCELRHGNAGCTPWGPPVPPAMDPIDTFPWASFAAGVA